MIVYQWPYLSSTHDLALYWAEKKEISFSQWVWLWAFQQSHGRGQFNRPFFSPPGGLYFTLLCPWPHLYCSPLVSLLLSLSVIDSTSFKLSIKWMNDLYSQELKVGGVLVNTVRNKEKTVCVMSIGLNVNTSSSDLPSSACSFSQKQDLHRLLEKIQQALYKRLCQYINGPLEPLVNDINRNLAFLHERVFIQTPQGWYQEIFHGTNTQGQAWCGEGKIYHALSIVKNFSPMA